MINIEDSDVVQLAIDDEQPAFVRREGQAVGLGEVFDHRRDVTAVRIDAIDIARVDLG